MPTKSLLAPPGFPDLPLALLYNLHSKNASFQKAFMNLFSIFQSGVWNSKTLCVFRLEPGWICMIEFQFANQFDNVPFRLSLLLHFLTNWKPPWLESRGTYVRMSAKEPTYHLLHFFKFNLLDLNGALNQSQMHVKITRIFKVRLL